MVMSSLLENISRSEFIFADEPVRLDSKDYLQAINYFVRELSQLEDVISIYQIGGLTALGISDVDLIVVLKDKVSDSKKILETAKGCVSKNSYLLDIFRLVDKATMQNIMVIFPTFDLKKIYGEDIEIRPITNEMIYATFLVDFVNSYWPREFLEMLLHRNIELKNKMLGKILYDFTRLFAFDFILKRMRKKIKVRYALCRLYSMRYPILMYKNITGVEYESWNNFLRKIVHLRQNWFSVDDRKYDLLLESIKEAAIISVELIDRLFDFMIKNNIAFDIGRQCKVEGIHSIVNIYVNNWEKNTAVKKMVKIYSRNITPNILPQNFLINFYFWNNPRMNGVNQDYLSALQERYELTKMHNAYLSSNNIGLEHGFFQTEYVFSESKRLSYIYNILFRELLKVKTKLSFVLS